MNILFSIIIPVYNVEKYLEECITSAIEQSYKNIEIILVNDGSTDKSIDICEEYSSKFRYIKVIHKENQGAASARNAGILESKGDYIIFLDSDDYWDDKDALKKISICLNESNSDVLIFQSKKYYEETNSLEKPKYNFQREYINLNSKKNTLNYMIKNNLYSSSSCTKVIKRKIIQKNKLFFLTNNLSEDIEWNARLMIFANTVELCEENFYVYRQRIGSTTHSITMRNLNDVVKNIELCLKYFDEYDLNSTTLKEEYMSYVAYQYVALLVLINLYDTDIDKEFMQVVKKYRYLLDYDLNKRVHIFKLINKYLGFRVLNIFITIYLKLRKV